MDDFLAETISKYFPNVSRETILGFNSYLDLIEKWNPKINLVSKQCTRQELIERHLLDSLQLINYIDNKEAVITDLGSGGGFPGFVLALAGYKCNLVEIIGKKAAFLREAALKLHTKSNIINQDFKTISGYKSDYIISRAVADINYLLKSVKNIVSDNTICLFLKSKNQMGEIEELSKYCSFELQVYKNIFNSDGVIIKIYKLEEWAK